ncbi:MAG: nucleotidyltransferase family protein [Chloroflexi bacterium]|nr:nucleotidyltransferase family protein [Chloroflexota bacterium]
MNADRIAIPERPIEEFCRRHHIRRLSLFGSVLRDDFRPESDIDVLVEFEDGHAPGFAFVALEEELSRLLGRRVDLKTTGDLNTRVREDVLSRAEPVYVAA